MSPQSQKAAANHPGDERNTDAEREADERFSGFNLHYDYLADQWETNSQRGGTGTLEESGERIVRLWNQSFHADQIPRQFMVTN